MCIFAYFNTPDITGYDQPRPAGRITVRCEEHDWSMLEGPVHNDTLCPIGKINQAVDDGLKRIGEALAKKGRAEDGR